MGHYSTAVKCEHYQRGATLNSHICFIFHLIPSLTSLASIVCVCFEGVWDCNSQVLRILAEVHCQSVVGNLA